MHSCLRGFCIAQSLPHPSHETLFPIEPPPRREFIAEPKFNHEARRNPESTFQTCVLLLIGECGGSFAGMGPRREVSLAEGAILVKTFGAIRAGRLVRAIGSFQFVGTCKAYFSELTRVVLKALKGL